MEAILSRPQWVNRYKDFHYEYFEMVVRLRMEWNPYIMYCVCLFVFFVTESICTLFLSVLQNNLISRLWRYSLFPIQYLTDFSRRPRQVNTLGPIQNGRHFADDIIKCIFVYENVRIPIKVSLKFVPEGPINNIPALVRIMAWRRPGDKPLSEPMMVRSPTHICVTRPQWVKIRWPVRIPWKLTGYSAAVREASLSCFVVISSFCVAI